jgi:hypothetical protein
MLRILFPLCAALLGGAFAAASLAEEAQPAPSAPPADPAAAFVAHHDTDADGKISQAEALAPSDERFREVDGNGDGGVTADEARALFEAKVPKEMQEKLKERGMEDPGGAFVKGMDANQDGKVDLAESQAPTLSSFKSMDTDGDGFATRDEVAAFVESMRQAHSAPPPAAQ